MSTDEIRIAVAELVGVVCQRCGGTGKYIRFGDHEWARRSGYAAEKQQPSECDHLSSDYHHYRQPEIPNYPFSLDACAEFEKTLTEEELDQYARELVFLMKTGEPRVFVSPPLRRCLGFLRVKGKSVERTNP